jgi:hypothetical protein
MSNLSYTWPEIMDEIAKDMVLLGWKPPVQSWKESPKNWDLYMENLITNHPKETKELLYRMSISELKIANSIFALNTEQSVEMIKKTILDRATERLNLRRMFH